MPGSLYDFIRRHLCHHGGESTRDELLVAILADQKAAERLARSQGLSSLLNNMKHSGDVLLDREMVIASARTYRRLGIRPTKD